MGASRSFLRPSVPAYRHRMMVIREFQVRASTSSRPCIAVRPVDPTRLVDFRLLKDITATNMITTHPVTYALAPVATQAARQVRQRWAVCGRPSMTRATVAGVRPRTFLPNLAVPSVPVRRHPSDEGIIEAQTT